MYFLLLLAFFIIIYHHLYTHTTLLFHHYSSLPFFVILLICKKWMRCCKPCCLLYREIIVAVQDKTNYFFLICTVRKRGYAYFVDSGLVTWNIIPAIVFFRPGAACESHLMPFVIVLLFSLVIRHCSFILPCRPSVFFLFFSIFQIKFSSQKDLHFTER